VRGRGAAAFAGLVCGWCILCARPRSGRGRGYLVLQLFNLKQETKERFAEADFFLFSSGLHSDTQLCLLVVSSPTPQLVSVCLFALLLVFVVC
jgi:hypothetical protein